MNVPFRIKLHDKFDEKLEKKFLLDAEKLKMRELNGHRSVGGIRASIFNAISLEEVGMLVDYMKKYALEHRDDSHKVNLKAQTQNGENTLVIGHGH
jgi:phosphoserine aminotransferase